MILLRVRILGYKSIQGWLENLWIGPKLTIFVGANEHGKTNLLEAITYFQKDKFQPNDLCRSKYFRYDSKEFSPPEMEFLFDLENEEKALVVKRFRDIEGKLPEEIDPSREELSDMVEAVLSDISIKGKCIIRVSLSGSKPRRFSYQVEDESKWYLDYPHDLNKDAKAFFTNMLPKIVGFSASKQLPNQITLDELNKGGSREFEGLLKLAHGVWEKKEKLFENSIDARDFRSKARNAIQRKLRGIWSQGKQGEANLSIDFDLDESSGHLRLDFIDKSGTRDQPSQRSLGFRSFFSFYLRLYAETREISPKGCILVFDEPGLHLHPSGQKDLLRELRSMSDKNQVIFATHSPFMIDRHISSKVIVVTKDSNGTKLDQKPYRKNWAPLRSSLGIVMNDTFYYADTSLFVEGTSDRMYIYAMMQKYSDELDIDINFLSIIDGDERKEMTAIARILLAEDRKLVLLVDKDRGGEEITKNIVDIARKKKKMKNLVTLNYGEFVREQDYASIEDLLPKGILEMAIQKYLKEILDIEEKFSIADVSNDNTLGYSLRRYFADKKWTSEKSNFSKTTVADFFASIFLESSDSIEGENPSKQLCVKLKELLYLK